MCIIRELHSRGKTADASQSASACMLVCFHSVSLTALACLYKLKRGGKGRENKCEGREGICHSSLQCIKALPFSLSFTRAWCENRESCTLSQKTPNNFCLSILISPWGKLSFFHLFLIRGSTFYCMQQHIMATNLLPAFHFSFFSPQRAELAGSRTVVHYSSPV